MLNSETYGIQLAGKNEISLDWAAMLRRKDSVVGQLTSGVRGLLQKNGVEVVSGWGEVVDPHTINVDGQVLTAEHLIIATGSRPNLPPIPGLEGSLAEGHAVTSTGALNFPEIPRELVVVGGGVVGIEFAVLFNALGSKVTVLERYRPGQPG